MISSINICGFLSITTNPVPYYNLTEQKTFLTTISRFLLYYLQKLRSAEQKTGDFR